MSKFVVEIETENDAFAGSAGECVKEVSRILREFANELIEFVPAPQSGNLFDRNGNRVGFFDFNKRKG